MAAQIPEVRRHCQLVADTLSVPVSWVFLAEISAAAFLAPTSPLPCKNRPLTHDALGLHPLPGATQTSGLMAFYSKTLRQIELWNTSKEEGAGGVEEEPHKRRRRNKQ